MPSADILVVDDTPANLHLLSQMLKNSGYKVRPVPGGALALKAIESCPPDLILLDITMPDMDGYEVCARLKANPATAEIPVLFISALGDTNDKVRAFKAGGVDYIAKPFQFEEVDARVRTHLALRRRTRELEESHARLKALERQRDSLTHMIVHDMRSPITVIGWSIELFRDYLPPSDAELADAYANAQSSVKQLSDMAAQMLDISRMEAGAMVLEKTPVPVAELLRAAVDEARCAAAQKRLALALAPVAQLSVLCDAAIVRRVVANLLGNAVKFCRPDGAVTVRAEARPGCVRISVEDEGPGIAVGDRERIFEKFVQVGTASRRQGTGLGLAFCRMAVREHGGAIGVDGEESRGSIFWFELPL